MGEEEEREEEAQRLKSLAEAKYKDNKLKSALKYVKRALGLCPNIDGLSTMVTSFGILRAASKSTAVPKWYKILQAEPFCHFNTIKKQYKKLALLLHPDKNPHVGSEEAFKLVNEAFRFLSDKIRRKEYDMKLRIQIQDGKMKESKESVRGDTFWTACSTCRLLHQFERKYLGHNLVCPSCRKSFEAIEVGTDEDGGGEDGINTVGARSERPKRRSSGDGEGISPSISNLKIGGVRSGRRVVSSEKSKGRAKTEELKRKGEKEIGDLKKEASSGEWGSGRLRKRMSSVGEIMERSEPKRVKVDEGTMTLAELQSQVKQKAREQRMRLKLKERKEMDKEKEERKEREKGNQKEKEKENEKQKVEKDKHREQEKERRGVPKRNRNLVAERDSVPKKSKDLELVNPAASKKSLRSGLERCRGSRGDTEIMAVEDSDFYDFDKDRVERSFKQGQVWAIYSDDDGMPRNYGLIDDVVSVNPFEVKLSWLDLQSSGDEGLRCWERMGFHLSCGRFKVSRKTSINSLNIFSHAVDCERAAREVFRIYPKKGSIWALYKESTFSREGRNLSVRDRRRYDIVVFLTTYSEMHGLSMAYLEKVDRFKTIFKRREIGSHAIRWLEKDDIRLFSHQIPARKLSGDEAPELSKDCWELDPASLPADLL